MEAGAQRGIAINEAFILEAGAQRGIAINEAFILEHNEVLQIMFFFLSGKVLNFDVFPFCFIFIDFQLASNYRNHNWN